MVRHVESLRTAIDRVRPIHRENRPGAKFTIGTAKGHSELAKLGERDRLLGTGRDSVSLSPE
jgi:hypothetical protein